MTSRTIDAQNQQFFRNVSQSFIRRGTNESDFTRGKELGVYYEDGQRQVQGQLKKHFKKNLEKRQQHLGDRQFINLTALEKQPEQDSIYSFMQQSGEDSIVALKVLEGLENKILML